MPQKDDKYIISYQCKEFPERWHKWQAHDPERFFLQPHDEVPDRGTIDPPHGRQVPSQDAWRVVLEPNLRTTCNSCLMDFTSLCQNVGILPKIVSSTRRMSVADSTTFSWETLLVPFNHIQFNEQLRYVCTNFVSFPIFENKNGTHPNIRRQQYTIRQQQQQLLLLASS